jgi:formate dehydrogenase maturation protein FdhE
MKITEFMIQNYLKDPNSCPCCGSDDIRGVQDEDWTTDTATRRILCNMCHAEWFEHFKLTTISDLKVYDGDGNQI